MTANLLERHRFPHFNDSNFLSDYRDFVKQYLTHSSNAQLSTHLRSIFGQLPHLSKRRTKVIN